MKLHLPKLLCAAVMTALAMPAMGADGPVKWDPSSGTQYSTILDTTKVQQDNNGNTYLDVCDYEGARALKYNWSGNLVIGRTAESEGHVDNVGAFEANWEWVTPEVEFPNVTASLKVDGNVTVQGNGRVVLGGGMYTGLEATEKITVNGGSLTATTIRANDLEVNSGTVSTHTEGFQDAGSSNFGGTQQSHIKNSVTISGGDLSFGYAGKDIQGIGSRSGRMTSFGDPDNEGFSMTQTGGTMRVYGDMALRDGATITQSGGAMMLRDTVWMDYHGTTTFNQSADSTLVIGRFESLKSSRTHGIVFNQSGEGLIHLAYGSNFKHNFTISLNQTGGGTINIGGGHDTDMTGELPTDYALDKVDTNASTTSFESVNTTYQINQSGSGEINIKEDATIVADSVNVGENAHLVVDGQLDIATGEGDSAKVYGTVSGTGTITVTSGVLENHGTISNTSSQAMFTADDIASLADTDALLITIAGGEFKNYGITDSSILVDGGTLTLDQGILADVTLNSGSIIVNSDSTTGTLTLNGGSIIFAEGATLTLTDGAELNLVDTIIELQVSEETLAGIINGTSTPVTLFETDGVTTDLKGITVNFTDGTNDHTAKVDGTEDGTGVVITSTVPEPTTATLSLLALAALAARRRRK